MLEVDIRKKLRNYTLDVSFDAGDDMLAILGASGCGKSMTLKCIAGLKKPDEGRIVLDGRVLFDSKRKIDLKPQERHVGYLFQNYALFPNMTVRQNLATGMKVKPHADKRNKKINELIKNFHLEGLEDAYPGKLSGGQQQRVALARMLASEPEVLLLDEPFSAMDAYLKEELQLNLKNVLSESFKGSCIMVTHDRDEAYRLCPEMLIMNEGTIVRTGRTGEVFADPDSYIAARVTGCKNLSMATSAGDGWIEALDWGIKLYVGENIREDLSAIGIRAHDLIPGGTFSASVPGENLNELPLNDAKVISGPFEDIITFSLENGTRLWWKQNINGEPLPEKLFIPPEKIMQLCAGTKT